MLHILRHEAIILQRMSRVLTVLILTEDIAGLPVYYFPRHCACGENKLSIRVDVRMDDRIFFIEACLHILISEIFS
jgi:hypothetical protein